MASPDELKKETVRIDLPLPTDAKSPDPNVKPRETVRIQLPARELPEPPAASTPLFAPISPTPDSPPSGLKKETVRVSLRPEPLPAPHMEKIPRPAAMPKVSPQNQLIAVARSEQSPMLLYWILLGVSALVLIIQIWTYFS